MKTECKTTSRSASSRTVLQKWKRGPGLGLGTELAGQAQRPQVQPSTTQNQRAKQRHPERSRAERPGPHRQDSPGRGAWTAPRVASVCELQSRLRLQGPTSCHPPQHHLHRRSPTSCSPTEACLGHHLSAPQPLLTPHPPPPESSPPKRTHARSSLVRLEGETQCLAGTEQERMARPGPHVQCAQHALGSTVGAHTTAPRSASASAGKKTALRTCLPVQGSGKEQTGQSRNTGRGQIQTRSYHRLH